MAEEPTPSETPPPAAAREWPIEVRPNGTVIFDGIAIGGLDFTEPPAGTPISVTEVPRLTLDLGWLRAAGVRVRILDDPTIERHRGGIVLER